MHPDERREMYVRRIGSIMRLDRDQIVTFRCATIDAMKLADEVEVTVDGRATPCVTVISNMPTEWQGEMLRSDGFTTDPSGGVRVIYHRDTSGMSAEQLADLVEWISVAVFETPVGYVPRVILYGNWARLVRGRIGPIPIIMAIVVFLGLLAVTLVALGPLITGRHPWLR